MITIRKNTFETNSSSTHSMVICTKDEYEKWANGELYASRWEDGFKTKDEVVKELQANYSEYFDENGNFIEDEDRSDLYYDSLEELISNESEWYTLDDWCGELECDENSYTSPSGDEIRIICRYGYDY